MTGRRTLAGERRLLVLAIGRGLRSEDAGAEQSLPESLTALVRQLEAQPPSEGHSAVLGGHSNEPSKRCP